MEQGTTEVEKREKHFVVRIAGIDAGVLAGLRCERARASVDRLGELDTGIASESQRLAEQLAQLVATSAGAAKPRLVGLRRELLGRRRPSASVVDALGEVLPRELIDDLQRVSERHRERELLRKELPETLRSDIQAAAAALRAAMSQPNVLLGLVYSNVEVLEDLRHWLGKPGTRPADKKAVRFAKYLSRIAAKTSPLTLFTSSGLGAWSTAGPLLQLAEPRPSSTAELGMSQLLLLVERLARRPEVARALVLRLNPSAAIDGDVVRFVTAGVTGTVRSLPLSPQLKAILASVAGRHTWGELESTFQQKLDSTQTRRAMDAISRLLRTGLLELCLPITDLELDVDTLLAWLDRQEAALGGIEEVCSARAALRNLSAALQRYASADAPEVRAAERQRIEAEVSRALGAGAGLGLPASGTALREGASSEATSSESRSSAPFVPKPEVGPVFFENAIEPTPAITLERRAWQPALDDLAAVARFAELFDPGLPTRLLLAPFVVERYGAGARLPLLGFYAAYEAELKTRQSPPGALVAARELGIDRVMWRAFSPHAEQWLADSPLPELRVVGRLRREALARLLPAQPVASVAAAEALLPGQARPPLDPLPPLQLSTADLLDLIAGCPGLSASEQGSLACYVQPSASAGAPRLTLNTIRFGLGTGRTRVEHLANKAFASQVRTAESEGAAVSSRPPPRSILAELDGVHGSTLNQRSAAVQHVITYPGAVCDRPVAQRISLGELLVVHDQSTGCVRLENHQGVEVLPVHTGLLALAYMPPLVQFLVNNFSRSSYFFSAATLASGAPARARATELPGARAHAQRWARLDVGRVTLRRAGWWIPAADVPRRRGEKDHVYWQEIARWRRDNGIPEQCFVRGHHASALLDTEAPTAAGSSAGGAAQAAEAAVNTQPWAGKDRKPMFIDFSSWHLVEVFARMFADGERDLIIEEVLPRLADAPQTAGGGARVVELIVEVPLGG